MDSLKIQSEIQGSLELTDTCRGDHHLLLTCQDGDQSVSMCLSENNARLLLGKLVDYVTTGHLYPSRHR